MCARLDMIAFIEQHLRDAAGLAEGQLHLPDVDIAVQIEGVAVAAAPLHPQPSSTDDHDDGRNDQDPLCRAGQADVLHADAPTPRRSMANTPGASLRMRVTSSARMVCMTWLRTVPMNRVAAARTALRRIGTGVVRSVRIRWSLRH